MLILGIDPGTAITGYGLIAPRGQGLVAVAYGTVTTPARLGMAERLLLVHEGLNELIAQHQPTEMAIEQLFFNRNVTTALVVGQARGVAILAAAKAGLPVYEYTPLQVKQSVVGYGRGRKEQVQEMVRLLLGLSDIPKPDDAADALAIAICHAHSARLNQILSGASP